MPSEGMEILHPFPHTLPEASFHLAIPQFYPFIINPQSKTEDTQREHHIKKETEIGAVHLQPTTAKDC